MSEQDLRLEIFNTLLTTPHRDLDKVFPVHRQMCEKDPLFYVRLGAWYHDKGEVRDHKEMFIVNLILSEFEGHRDVGLALLRMLPPYEVVRVLDFIHGKRIRRITKSLETRSAPGLRDRLRDLLAGRDAAGPSPRPRVIEKTQGLGKGLPRSMRTEIERYVREREADHDWFDECVLQARKAMKRMYALLHIRPSERAQKILFDGNPHNLEFVTRFDRVRRGGLYVTRLFHDPRENSLKVGYYLYHPDVDPQAENFIPDQVTILQDIAGLRLAYYGKMSGKAAKWHDSWGQVTRLPRLLRIEIETVDGVTHRSVISVLTSNHG